MIARRSREDGATRPKKMPWTTAATDPGRWSRVSSPMPTQNGTRPRGTGRVTQRSAETLSGRNRAANISGAKAMIPASTALSSTGISSSSPATRSGAVAASSSETLAPSDVPPTTACSAPRWSSSVAHLVGEGGHRVRRGVLRPVGPTVAEQVEGDHVEALGGQPAGQRLVHPARHQLAVQQHDPPVPGAVLGVLQPVAAGVVVEEELPDAFGDQHARSVGATRADQGRESLPNRATWERLPP